MLGLALSELGLDEFGEGVDVGGLLSLGQGAQSTLGESCHNQFTAAFIFSLT